MTVRASIAMILTWAAVATAAAADGGPRVVLDETGYWRQYCRFGPDRVSADLLASDGEKLLGPAGLRRVRKDAEDGMRKSGLDPTSADWRNHAYLRFFFDQYPPYFGPLPPDDWAQGDFDDAAWVLHHGLILQPEKGRIIPRGGGWTAQDLDQESFSCLGLQACYYRARFIVDDPAKVDELKFACQYRGGMCAFLNGRQIASKHASSAPADAPAEPYPLEAYTAQPELRDRTATVTIPSKLLRAGVNVLAIEVRASRLHPQVFKMNLPQDNHKVRQGKEGLWRHAGLTKVELTTVSPAVRSGLNRPAGVQAWVQDMHHRTDSAEFLPAGEPAGSINLAGPRNGTLAAQVLVGSDSPLRQLRLAVSDLSGTGGQAIPALAIAVSYLTPMPADEFTRGKLGDDRGLDATFPDGAKLAGWRTLDDAARLCVFDQLASTPRPTIPAGTCQPVWLSLRVPPDSKAGVYEGQVTINAENLKDALRLPVRVEVLDWRLPDSKDFRTVVACEQNPYAVARQYNVKLWSAEHFKLLEASFIQLARVGNDWLNVPVIAHTEFGNGDDSPIRWTRKKDGTLSFDSALLDAYLDLAIRACGQPRVVNFVVMQGMRSTAKPPAQPGVWVDDEASGQKQMLPLSGIAKGEKEQIWRQFATLLHEHMKARKLDGAMCWGYPLEQEDDPELKALLAKFAPQVRWAANPHEMFFNAVYAKDSHYGVITTVRFQHVLPGLRLDEGWRSQLLHLHSPRTGGNVLAVHTVSYPFAYRVLPGRALATGHCGIGRIGADEWAATHYCDMGPTAWLTGMPVLFVLWPGPGGAASSTRFEALIEGVQEAEARIAIEQALAGGKLPADLSRRAKDVLAEHDRQTGFLGGTLCVHELERYYAGWQSRSARLFRMAGEVAAPR